MANPQNLDDQPGQSTGVPSITRGDAPRDTFTSKGYGGESSVNEEGESSGVPETNAEGPSKYQTGYGGEESSPQARSGGTVPAAGLSDDPTDGKRHTGYVRSEAERRVSTTRKDLVGKPPSDPRRS